MTGKADYTAQWKRLRVLNAAYWGGLFFGTILALAIGLTLPPKMKNFVVPIWLVTVLAASAPYQYFRCPRCNKPFFKPNFLSYNGFAQACPHCGLKKWAIHS